MSKYYELVPVSILPEKDGEYFVESDYADRAFFNGTFWCDNHGTIIPITHWLSPVEPLPGNQWVKASVKPIDGTYPGRFAKSLPVILDFIDSRVTVITPTGRNMDVLEWELDSYEYIDESPSPLIDEVERLKKENAGLMEKCARYDELRDEIGQFYSEDYEDNDADLLDIGEAAARHFEYL